MSAPLAPKALTAAMGIGFGRSLTHEKEGRVS